MEEFKKKNDYTVIIFAGTNCLGKMVYAHNLYAVSQWLSKSDKYVTWTYMNVYARRSGRFLGRFYRGNFIPAYLV